MPFAEKQVWESQPVPCGMYCNTQPCHVTAKPGWQGEQVCTVLITCLCGASLVQRIEDYREQRANRVECLRGEVRDVRAHPNARKK